MKYERHIHPHTTRIARYRSQERLNLKLRNQQTIKVGIEDDSIPLGHMLFSLRDDNDQLLWNHPNILNTNKYLLWDRIEDINTDNASIYLMKRAYQEYKFDNIICICPVLLNLLNQLPHEMDSRRFISRTEISDSKILGHLERLFSIILNFSYIFYIFKSLCDINFDNNQIISYDLWLWKVDIEILTDKTAAYDWLLKFYVIQNNIASQILNGFETVRIEEITPEYNIGQFWQLQLFKNVIKNCSILSKIMEIFRTVADTTESMEYDEKSDEMSDCGTWYTTLNKWKKSEYDEFEMILNGPIAVPTLDNLNNVDNCKEYYKLIIALFFIDYLGYHTLGIYNKPYVSPLTFSFGEIQHSYSEQSLYDQLKQCCLNDLSKFNKSRDKIISNREKYEVQQFYDYCPRGKRALKKKLLKAEREQRQQIKKEGCKEDKLDKKDNDDNDDADTDEKKNNNNNNNNVNNTNDINSRDNKSNAQHEQQEQQSEQGKQQKQGEQQQEQQQHDIQMSNNNKEIIVNKENNNEKDKNIETQAIFSQVLDTSGAHDVILNELEDTFKARHKDVSKNSKMQKLINLNDTTNLLNETKILPVGMAFDGESMSQIGIGDTVFKRGPIFSNTQWEVTRIYRNKDNTRLDIEITRKDVTETVQDYELSKSNCVDLCIYYTNKQMWLPVQTDEQVTIDLDYHKLPAHNVKHFSDKRKELTLNDLNGEKGFIKYGSIDNASKIQIAHVQLAGNMGVRSIPVFWCKPFEIWHNASPTQWIVLPQIIDPDLHPTLPSESSGNSRSNSGASIVTDPSVDQNDGAHIWETGSTSCDSDESPEIHQCRLNIYTTTMSSIKEGDYVYEFTSTPKCNKIYIKSIKYSDNDMYIIGCNGVTDIMIHSLGIIIEDCESKS